ncbi:DUF3846 domain-containing protein [Streptomyces sp. NBC_01174]|uniref:DUF3846 domain-containing protein n=1 Tax=Streptomyces sp. NBC_01174 TaxID=2903758 RepID=UPI002F91153C|nr:DUF3846 domain-containing protein [Streptomyces sp. NBC_01174]
MNHALLLRTDGSFELLDWPKEGQLNALYRAVSCQNIDAVDLSDRLTMWLDDEGLINGSPVNRAATLLYAAHRPPHQRYHGHAVITGGTDRHGNTLGLTQDEIAEIVELHLSHTAVVIPAQRTN